MIAAVVARADGLEALQVFSQERGGSGRLDPLPATSGTADVLVTARCRMDLTSPGVEIVGSRAQADVLEDLQVLRRDSGCTGVSAPRAVDSGSIDALVTALRPTNITFPGVEIVGRRVQADALEAVQVLCRDSGCTGVPAPMPADSGSTDVLVTAQCRSDMTSPGVEIVGRRAQTDVLEALQNIRRESGRAGLPVPLPADSGFADSGSADALVTALRRTTITPPIKEAVDRHARRQEATT